MGLLVHCLLPEALQEISGSWEECPRWLRRSGYKRVNEYLCFCKDKFEEIVVTLLKNVINAHETDCSEAKAFFLSDKDDNSLQVLLKLAVDSKHVEAGKNATHGKIGQNFCILWLKQLQVAYHSPYSPSMALEAFLFSFVFNFLFYGGRACDAYTGDGFQLLQHANAFRAQRYGTWALPRDWKTHRDIANVSDFEPITWGSVENQDVLLTFSSAIPVFGEGGNYIALLHGNGLLLRYLETGELSLFCSGPNGSHRTKVRGLGNETRAAHKAHFVFLCGWPGEEKHLERFEVFLDNGHGKQLGTVVAEQKNGLLQQYRTVACLRDVWPSETIGLRQLPQWMEFHLLHGVEHFLIYTVNLDSEILVDLYEPYIKSGVATRVHFNKEVKGADPYHFHAPLHYALMADCLYRFKNHATWLLPSIDIDEFTNMKDGNLFEGGRVPEDYVGSSWDAIVKNSGLQAGRVHSIAFNIYRFAQVQPGQVELSSVLREPILQPTCPKYVLNVNNVNTVFAHWATSWKNGTQGLVVVDKDMLVLHHYRQPVAYGREGPPDTPPLRVEANTTDASMQQYVPRLSRSLEARFHEKTPSFLSRLSAVETVPFPASSLHRTAMFSQAVDPACAAWTRSLSKLNGIASLDPPPIDPPHT
eukprot:s753_g7.t1